MICHYCSGEKVYEPPEEPEQEPESEEPQEASGSVLLSSLRDRIVISSEWLVLLLCLGIIAVPQLTDREQKTEELVLASEEPGDLAEYCLGRLDEMEYQEKTTTLVEVKAACQYPIDVTEVDGLIVVRSPDEEIYGFVEIEVETNPVFITITQ